MDPDLCRDASCNLQCGIGINLSLDSFSMTLFNCRALSLVVHPIHKWPDSSVGRAED